VLVCHVWSSNASQTFWPVQDALRHSSLSGTWAASWVLADSGADKLAAASVAQQQPSQHESSPAQQAQ